MECKLLLPLDNISFFNNNRIIFNYFNNINLDTPSKFINKTLREIKMEKNWRKLSRCKMKESYSQTWGTMYIQ